MMRNQQALRKGTGRLVRALELRGTTTDDINRAPITGNPQKYTYRESLSAVHPCDCGASADCPTCGGTGERLSIDAHCHSLKPRIADNRNWPIYRAALVDCLPASKQAEIRELFQ